MNKESLVVLKGQTTLVVERSGTRFEPNKHYRAIKQDDNSIIVFGELLDMGTFNNMFEFLHDRLMREFKKLSLLKDNGQPITKKLFTELMSVHTYGKGQGKLFIGFHGGKMNGIWAFYGAYRGDTKAQFVKDAYRNYTNILEGHMSLVDNESIQRGNSGIPMSFGDIYFRKEWNPNNEKREIYC